MAEISINLQIETKALGGLTKEVAGHLLKSVVNIAEGHPEEIGTLYCYSKDSATLSFEPKTRRGRPTAEYELHIKRGDIRVEKHVL